MAEERFRKFRRRKGQLPAAQDAVQPRPTATEPSSGQAGAGSSASSRRPERLKSQPPLVGLDDSGTGFETATGSESSQIKSSTFWDVEPMPALPARLPDPWHVMRRVELADLNARRTRLPLVDFFRSSPTARSFDLLRTRLLRTLRDHGWKRVAICSPTSGCGASFTAANLALSLARVPGNRTVLMDLNLRNPGIARAMGLERAALYNGDMHGLLRGEVRVEDHLVAASDGLALGLNNTPCYNASEILHEMRSAASIDNVIQRTRADVALFDLPPVLETDDLAAFLPQVDGVLLVSDGSQTTARHLKACEAMLAGHTQLLGVVLNRARAGDGFATAH
ncbi:CpsD/CapB family tyrosine-protein kinase [Tritonibacter horizontis]|uniref:Tyrosine-protein kinase YwqD n=1 Tax=Tritonibacter horizontis TaxID=1768241 RepID=A0A132BVM8_9RHOB|nr:CpsD/CapB family tyrosine-protein kinase [Tritonibacter horizontis]KUP92431.1 tyrosine-protein kinase YwqD [Tritonibacter horizontis]